MDTETEQMLVWVNTEIKTFEQTLVNVQAHLNDLHQLRGELLNSTAEHSGETSH